MGDAAPAEGTERGAARSQLFDPGMRSVARRLRTFQRWPRSSPVSPRDLVEAGFFYVGPRDEVQCFCCGGVLKDWRPGDCPIIEHLNFFPSCKYICGEDVGNQEMLSLQEIFDTVDGQFLSLLQGIVSEETALPNEPEYPEMVTEEMRLSTFQNWPQNSDIHPEQLARAGFFYTGRGDVVRCFYCDGGVRSWSFGDDPWREHAKWYPECEFLLHSKGREFVNSVQETFSTTVLAPRHSWDQTEQDSPPSQDPLSAWEELAHPSQDQRNIVHNVLQMGFDPTCVANLVENKFRLMGAFYLSESELISDLLQSGRAGSSGAVGSRDPVWREAGTSREEMQSGQQKESDESQLSTEEQLRRLQEERMCKVCLDRDVSVVFVPCGHLVACGECALNLRLCPICRAVIQGSVRTFMS
ncbi:baculoviral IAP repeat-containing protein 7 isoform X1 [Myiozetetes cayanensis]|uniref:baculoviral IAP repeat-containing protein 7 isoform X1 n=1 Tax=Myiozetetes cayanensis TaxID=478635 RepID=UPI00215F59DB|nr:baculoviral IAP repeat-containing protein 7 isoform X1 [Myiozetetes cayanensis]